MHVHHEKRVYGCEGPNIADIAQRLADAVSMPMYANFSGMIGTWYSSHDDSELMRSIADEDLEAARAIMARGRSYPDVTITHNDPDPEYGGPAYPGGASYIVVVKGDGPSLERLETLLLSSPLGLRRLE
jgi:hypothetical protein